MYRYRTNLNCGHEVLPAVPSINTSDYIPTSFNTQMKHLPEMLRQTHLIKVHCERSSDSTCNTSSWRWRVSFWDSPLESTDCWSWYIGRRLQNVTVSATYFSLISSISFSHRLTERWCYSVLVIRGTELMTITWGPGLSDKVWIKYFPSSCTTVDSLLTHSLDNAYSLVTHTFFGPPSWFAENCMP